MGRSVSGAPAASGGRPESANGPGSNGYWRRDIFRSGGTHAWTAKKDGKIKVQGLGAAAGANGVRPGASAAFGEKILSVTAGDVLTIVIGSGGLGIANSADTASNNGTSTSISGTPVGATPLTLTGAAGSLSNGTGAVAGVATGPWDKSNPGAVATSGNTGSPSSGSPFGPGKASSQSGGSGWGGSAGGTAGSSTHGASVDGTSGAPPGLETMAIFLYPGSSPVPLNSDQPVTLPFWDFESVDSAGGAGLPGTNGQYLLMDAGPGAGGGGNPGSTQSGRGGRSALGGGTGRTFAATPPSSGFGAGGGAVESGPAGGKGGDAFVMIFWDEVL